MKKLKIGLNIIAILTIFHLLMFYIGWNIWVYLNTVFQFEYALALSILVGLFSYSYIIGRFVKFLSIFHTIGSIWFAVIQYGVIFLPIANFIVWLLTLASVPSDTAIFWIGNLVIVSFAFIFAYGLFNAYSPVVRHHDIHIAKKMDKHQKLRMAVASDMHFGSLSGRPHARKLVQLINENMPDLILLPGDIIDDDPNPFIDKQFGKILKELHAPLGVYGVLGNHEYYGGKIPTFTEEMDKINIHILQDEIVKVEDSFYLVGRKDKTDKKRYSIEELLNSNEIDRNLPIIMMDHQPQELEQAMKNGVDLILSGHTHRGQMAPNHLFTKKLFELDWGYKQKNQLHAFVSSGYGFWGPPIRIGSRSEILVIDIRFS